MRSNLKSSHALMAGLLLPTLALAAVLVGTPILTVAAQVTDPNRAAASSQVTATSQLTTTSQVSATNQAAATRGSQDVAYQVGTGKVKITPERPIWMAGYASRTSPFQEILADIWTKAIVLQDAKDQRLVLVTLDLVGVDYGLSEDICARLKDRFGLQRSQISIATSHSHSGPVVGKNLRAMHFYQLDAQQQHRIVDYSQALVDKIEQAVGQAIDSLQPAKLQWFEGQATFATNRRNNPEAEVPQRRAENRLAGPVDHSVPVLVAFDSKQNPFAIVFGYACHSTVLSQYKICGDYPGFAQTEIERRFPGCTALFWAGCGADINPLPRRSETLAQLYGLQLAVAVESAIRTQAASEVSGSWSYDYQLVPLRLAELPTTEDLERQSNSANVYEAMRAKLLLEQIQQGQPLSPTYNYPVQTWRLGDGPEWIHLGGEVVVDFAVRFKNERKDKPVWVTSYANDVMAYIPSERVLSEGGYEGATSMVYYGLPTVWAPGVEQTVVDAVNRQLNR